MPVTFSRGAPAPGTRTTAPRFEGADLMPLAQKEDLCRQVLAEFGIANIRERAADHELIHACLVDPTHTRQDTEPTASLNYENLGYRCLGCGAKGFLPWLIAMVRGCSTEEAIGWLNGETGMGGSLMDLGLLMKYFDMLYRPKAGLPPIPTFPRRMLEPWALIHPYLTDPKSQGGRGIPEANVLQMQLGYAEEYKIGQRADKTWITSERIVIPHFWKGELVGWQSRRLDTADGTSKYLSSADFPKDQTIYNYQPRHTGTVVVMEAMLSAASKVHLEPHPEATFGASITDEQMRLLEKHPRIVLFMDNDKAGWEAVQGHTDLWADGRVRKHHPGMGERLGLTSTVFVVENPWAADPQDISDEDYLELVGNAVPYAIWQRPTELLCYSCREVAHDGPC